jgi:hypothetical protein
MTKFLFQDKHDRHCTCTNIVSIQRIVLVYEKTMVFTCVAYSCSTVTVRTTQQNWLLCVWFENLLLFITWEFSVEHKLVAWV